MGILFKNTANILKNFLFGADEIYLGTESPGNKVLKSLDVPEALPTMFKNVGGFMELATPYKRPLSTEVNFNSSGIIGEVDLPIYDTFTIDAATVIKANRKNTWEVIFSCNTVPSNISSPESYMTVTGSILTGYANLNKITFELEYNSVGVLKVITTITQWPGANTDPMPPSVIVNMQFNQNSDLVANPILLNTSKHGLLVEPNVINPSDATWNDLTGGNYSLQTGNNATAASRSYVQVDIDPTVLANLTNKITIIARFRKRATTTTPTSEFQIFGNSKTGTTGFNFSILFGSNRPEFHIGSERVRGATDSMDVVDAPVNDSWHCVALVYDGSTGFANTYYKSSDRSIAFANIGLVNAVNATMNTHSLYKEATFELNRVPSPTTEGVTATPQIQEDRDVLIVRAEALTALEVETIMNTID